MNRELYRETFSRLRVSDQAKEELMNMAEEKKTGKVRAFKAARAALIAAALCLALVGTAFAANAVTDGAVLRSLMAILPDGTAIEIDEFTVIPVEAPDSVKGAYLQVSDEGAVLLSVVFPGYEETADITDELEENGGRCHFQVSQNGYSADIEIYPGASGYQMRGSITGPGLEHVFEDTDSTFTA